MGEGGGTHRSWPGGQGGRSRPLVAEKGWGGRVSPQTKEGVGWLFQDVEGRPLGPRPLGPRLDGTVSKKGSKH